MELALPIIALGGLYVISNQKQSKNKLGERKREKETFVNMGKPAQNAYLTNTNIPAENYPTTNQSSLLDTVERYPNPNTATDKYFNQNEYEKKVNQGVPVDNQIQNIYSLSGNYLDTTQFKHNNMVPFYGGKMKGYTYDTQIAETILDNMAGTGSQIIKKIEQAPLFKPEDNMQWAFGTPNNSDFYQSRVNPGMRNNNVKPFDSEYVAPGLNLGYTTNGSGGFNSGMLSRDEWLPKTVDQLRVATNPKLEYSLDGFEGPANAEIKQRGLIGRVEKQKPDRFFINNQERWLTTTGAEKGETLRPIQEMGVIRRPDCELTYTGPAGKGDKHANYVAPAVEPPKREELGATDIPHSSAVGKGPIDDGQQWIESYTNYNNHRSTLAPVDSFRSGFSNAIGAVIAPIMDVLRPSRKDETVANIRVYGEAGSMVPANYVINPQDITPTTVKETTLYSPGFNIDNQKGEYVNTYQPYDETQRDTTSCSYIGSSGGPGAQYGDRNNQAEYNQRNNDIKSQTIHNRTQVGNTNLFNNQMNIGIAKQDSDAFNYRMPTPHSVFNRPPAKENYGAIRVPQYYNECVGCERIDPSLLDAFRSNPYTHSLTNSV